MTIPPLDGRGFLPDGLYIATLKQVKDVFVTSKHRENLWSNFLDFIEHVHDKKNTNKYLGISYETTIMLSGSFISNSLYPKDIDCIFILDSISNENKWFWASRIGDYKQSIKFQFGVDFNLSFPNGNDFEKFFAYIGPTEAEARNLNPKELRGIIKLKL